MSHRPRLALDRGRARALLHFGRWILAAGVIATAGLQAIFVATTLALVWPLTRVAGLTGAALARVPAELLVCAACVWLARNTLDRPFRKLARPLAAVTGSGIAAAATAVIGARVVPGAQGPVISGLGALAVAAAVLWVLDRSLRLGLLGTVAAAARALLRDRVRAVSRAEPVGE